MNFEALLDDWQYMLWGTFPDGPPGGALLTLILSSISGVLSAIFGIVFGITLVMGHGPALHVLRVVLNFLRAIPVLMLIFWTYFLLPVLWGIDVPSMFSVVCALSLVSGAYLAHGVAAGIGGIAQGQWSAGAALGMTRWQVLRFLILPQALTVMLPSFVNQWITLIKDQLFGVHRRCERTVFFGDAGQCTFDGEPRGSFYFCRRRLLAHVLWLESSGMGRGAAQWPASSTSVSVTGRTRCCLQKTSHPCTGYISTASYEKSRPAVCLAVCYKASTNH